MMMAGRRGLLRDESGKGVIKFALFTCMLAGIFATSSPAFEANPLINGKIMEMRKMLPDTLEQARRAMGGD